MFVKKSTKFFKSFLAPTILGAVILGLYSTHFTQTAFASTPRCGAHNDIVGALEKKYGETVRGLGFVADKGLMQVLVSPEKGTWTIIMTNPQGQSCLVAAGKGWEELKQKTKENEA